MSYEGYEVFVCPEGHRWILDAFDAEDADKKCPHCGKAPAWSCAVDQTNGDEIEPKLEIVKAAPTCGSCGQTTGPVRYVVPGPEVKAVVIRGENTENGGESRD